MAEDLFIAELTRRGCVAWATGGTLGKQWLPDGRQVAIRQGNDIFSLFDIAAISPQGVTLAQVKGGRRYEGPDRSWRARFAALPHPPGLVYCWAWLSPDGWRVWRLLPDGTRLELAWTEGAA